MILFEQEDNRNVRKQMRMKVGFKDLNMVSKIPVIIKEQKQEINFLTNQ
jgi:hypothetical protein